MISNHEKCSLRLFCVQLPSFLRNCLEEFQSNNFYIIFCLTTLHVVCTTSYLGFEHLFVFRFSWIWWPAKIIICISTITCAVTFIVDQNQVTATISGLYVWFKPFQKRKQFRCLASVTESVPVPLTLALLIFFLPLVSLFRKFPNTASASFP